tara:strand:- start:203 stop:361 length:159 start_codon:yes stop_codon:yes gene_type:complete
MSKSVDDLLKKEGVPLAFRETGAVGAVWMIVKIQALVVGFGLFVYGVERLFF